MVYSVFTDRRTKLFSQLADDCVVLVSSGDELIRNRDVEYPFRAQSDFHYLTGFDEPDSLLVLHKKLGLTTSTLFLRPKDPTQETWQGRRLGAKKAAETLNLDAAWPNEKRDTEIPCLLEDIESVYFSFTELVAWNPLLSGWISGLKQKVRTGVTAPTKLVDLDEILHEMRLFKSADELVIMREAAQISVKGHLAAMRHTRPGCFEHEIQANVEFTFRKLGSERVAFGTIAAGGENACILHYTQNNAVLHDGDLILVDAGAEFNGYAGDITTTFPVSGKFSVPQAKLYSLVLKAQQAAIKKVIAGNSYQEMHLAAARELSAGLINLGLLSGSLESVMDDEGYKAFFMHGTGHWLGRDVHDVGRYKINGQWRNFEAGMVVTVEPGLYVPLDADVDEQWKGIGIRIEDDIAVTETGNEVLTTGLPRTVDEIEAWMAQR